MDYVKALTELEYSPDLHVARIVLLLEAFTVDSEIIAIVGLTKLAKLDFLLRYPVMLERALKAKGQAVRNMSIQDHERYSVESEMVRYRFGPWDHRYREFLNILSSKELVSLSISGRTIGISLTATGHEQASLLSEIELFKQYIIRAKILKRHFDLTATNLMKFIYATFPEVISLRSNRMITI